ncbi:MAG TPA: 50S ribosomal protein L29 [Ignavibacteriaceae bacterium]|jgi:large subunit ribosomal protein L29|uniref:Large ribosomal subunit protein uL29 n=1 Tax=uncultured Ignavibacteria bacterium Rifle_16ft_4_minimus_20697 TaxID=1665100 RepID=A0A0H4T1X0_9BACT|nr:50S ribosomal protein L29, large subunit ribosomal protein L29 [uncultured Ignavibacteria bacterium Rifle_16ft_4_minimus_20697]
MKIHEIREMKDAELIKRIEEEEKNLVDLRFSHQLKQLTNTAKLKLAKKDIAKMKTILKERELAQKTASAESKG